MVDHLFRCQRCGKWLTFEQVICQVPICLCIDCTSTYHTWVRNFQRYKAKVKVRK